PDIGPKDSKAFRSGFFRRRRAHAIPSMPAALAVTQTMTGRQTSIIGYRACLLHAAARPVARTGLAEQVAAIDADFDRGVARPGFVIRRVADHVMAVNLRGNRLHSIFEPPLLDEVELAAATRTRHLSRRIFYEDALGIDVNLFQERHELSAVPHAEL